MDAFYVDIKGTVLVNCPKGDGQNTLFVICTQFRNQIEQTSLQKRILSVEKKNETKASTFQTINLTFLNQIHFIAGTLNF